MAAHLLNPEEIRTMLWTAVSLIVGFGAGWYVYKRWGSVIEGRWDWLK